MKRLTLACLLSVCVVIVSAEPPRLRPGNWTRPVLSKHVDNWYQVDEKLYRCAQPDRDGMKELQLFGIREVLNLRDLHTDADEAQGTALKLHRIRMRAGGIRPDDVVEALRIIISATGPVAVHCWHGSDRTGAVIVAYRLVIQDWSSMLPHHNLL